MLRVFKSGLLIPSVWLLAALPPVTPTTGQLGNPMPIPTSAPKMIFAKRDSNSSLSASASTSTSAAPSSSSTSALTIATSLLSSANGNCTATGGGCAVLASSLPMCDDDTCACEDAVTLAAQVCAQCDATTDQVKVYNTFLQTCQDEGLSDPSETITVTVGDDVCSSSGGGATGTASTGVQTEVVGTSTITITSTSVPASSLVASATGVSSSVGASSSSGALGSIVAFEVGNTVSQTGSSGSASTSTLVITSTSSPNSSRTSSPSMVIFDENGSANSSSSSNSSSGSSNSVSNSLLTSLNTLAINVSSSLTASINPLATATATATAKGTILLETQSSTGETNTSALNAAVQFFTQSIDSECTTDCSDWYNLAANCTEDSCICTDAGRTGASSCSGCVGGAGHSDASAYTIQMAAYSEFASNCTAETSFNLSSTSVISAIETVASAGNSTGATGTLSGSNSISGSGGATAVIAANEGVTTVVVDSNGATGRVRGVGWEGVVIVLAGMLGARMAL